MPRAKPKPQPPPPAPPAPAADDPAGEVLTLPEAAAYLRFSEADVLRLVEEQNLLARRLANEWRFLKAAIPQWLRGDTALLRANKEAWASLAGKYKDDPDLLRICEEAYRRRGRSGTG